MSEKRERGRNKEKKLGGKSDRICEKGQTPKFSFLLFLKCRIINHQNESNFEIIAHTIPEI